MPIKYSIRKSTRSKLKQFHGDELLFKQTIIKEYLPKLLNGEITINDIEKELKTSIHTIDGIVKNYYIANENKQGIEEYKEAKRQNMGHSIEQRKKTEGEREEVSSFEIVNKKEFLSLTDEEKDKQIIMKIRKTLLDYNRKKQAYPMSDNTARERVKRITEFFKELNDQENNVINFSDENIRNILFDYPGIVKRDKESLNKKIDVFKSFEEIGEKKTYEMIKKCPGILGYDTERTQAQLDLLKSEGLIDYVINKPSGLMTGVSTMQALIEFAKERYAPNDLKGVTRSNIFMANATLKNSYQTDYNALKERFLNKKTDDNKCKINAYALGICGTTDIDVQKIESSMEVLNSKEKQRVEED